MQHPPSPFVRDRLTVLSYAMVTVFGFGAAALGPAMPSLRSDLDIGRTLGGFHFTALAGGAVVAGFMVERLVVRFGRRAAFWCGGGGAAAGSLLIGVGWHAAVTIFGAFIVGAAGAVALAVVQAMLADRHPAHRSVALTEANTAMSFGAVGSALLVGGAVAVGLGWRAAFLAPLAVWVTLVLVRRTEPFLEARTGGSSRGRGRLSRTYWWFWSAVIPAVGAEWSVGAWGAGYLVDISGTSEGAASALMTTFFGAMLIGRLVGGRVARRIEPFALLSGAITIALLGVGVFWASESVSWVVAGLLIGGLGIAMLFPMLTSLAMATAPDHSDLASARMFVSGGGATMIAPLALGSMADAFGIRAAFGMVPALLVVCLVVALVGRRSSV